LLIDADMRLPSSTIWDLLNDAGLSNVLVGQAQLGKALKVMVNLHVPAGVTPPSIPSGWLD